jgi:hypothetical protein
LSLVFICCAVLWKVEASATGWSLV